jgi:two-component system, LytTR family, response regulator
MVERMLAQYRIVGELGRGGMGIVYRAQDTRLGRDVALKVLPPTVAHDPRQKDRLLQEARAAASLVHPSLCVIYEIAEAEGGVTFVAMELVRGETVAALLKRGSLPIDRVVAIALEVADGLSQAHGQGIVHRDLKPTNVMLTEAGRAKVIDFGLAKLVRPVSVLDSGDDTPRRGQSDPGRIIGTAAYMSPEQVRGAEVDARSDVFSLGATLHEMVSGLPPFRRASGVETLHAVLKEPQPRLSDLGVVGAALELQPVIDRCLEKEPARRYASMADLIADLEGVGLGPQALSHPVSTTARIPAPKSVLRVLVVDDEDPARALLAEYLRTAPEVEIVGECRNGFEAVKAVSESKPDLVFLDIQMPKLDGFEVLELIGREVAVVFVTAFDEHAIRAFEVNAVDYLLKPVSADRFGAALERARKRVHAHQPAPVPQLLAEMRPPGSHLDRILVRQGPSVHVIPAGALDYAVARDDYVGLSSRGKEHLKQQTLAELQAALDPKRFVRIHRSYLLNVDRLTRIEADTGDSKVAVLTDGTRLPVSRAGYGRLKGFL